MELFGAGMDLSFLRALDWRGSAVVIIGSQDIVVRDLQVNSPRDDEKERTGDPVMSGFFVDGGHNIEFHRVKVFNCANVGILFYGVRSSGVWDSKIIETLADGIHVTNKGSTGSTYITIKGNYAYHTGDDSFATVGYKGNVNQWIWIKDNVSDYSHASGVTVEGSKNVEVHRNSIYRSKVAGIRVGSSEYWKTSGINEVDVRDNVLQEVRLDQNVPHPAILVFAEYENVRNVHVASNTIKDPLTWMAFNLYGQQNGRCVCYTDVQNNLVNDGFERIINCIVLGVETHNITISGNRIFSEMHGMRDCE